MSDIDEELEAEHGDRLTVSRMNNDGSKLLTASVDHRVTVYNIDLVTGKQTRLDVFSAHDAEVRDARWFDKRVGSYFITIGHDLQARIFVEDVTQAPMSGRRFRRTAKIACEQFVPYMSVDVKTVGGKTFIILIDRLGLLSLYEPSEAGEYSEWTLVDQLYVTSPTPSQGDHTYFRAIFDQNLLPLPYILNMSNDAQQLTVAVSVFDYVKIYRSSSDSQTIAKLLGESPGGHGVGQGGSHRLCFFEVMRLQPVYTQAATSAGALIRDIAFRPGNVRGSDVLALACTNGSVAVYDIDLQASPESEKMQQEQTPKHMRPVSQTPQGHQSNLTSALHHNTPSAQTAQQVALRTKHPFPYKVNNWPVTIKEDAHTDTWSVAWDRAGDMLFSTGSEGTMKMWKWIVTTADGFGTYQVVAESRLEEDSDVADDDSSFEEVETKS